MFTILLLHSISYILPCINGRMPTIPVPFRLPGFRIAQVQATSDTQLTITAHATARRSHCPRCQQLSRRIHSYYIRTPRDVPISAQTVQLRLHVRRFRCLALQCAQRTFAERLPEVVPVAARRTVRLTSALQTLAFATGGEAGARLSHRLHMPSSPDTLLRIMRRAPRLTIPPPRVLGVDDFAFRKGCRYGTLVVDLERQRRIDLLPDRTATTLQDWLVQHPTVEVLTRDRSTEYARGATAGAPQALQVADRWPLLHNLREALERMLHRRHTQLERLPDASVVVAQQDGGRPDVGAHTALRIPTASEQTISARARARRIAQYHAVRTLHAEGRNILQIAKQLKMSRITVRKYVQAEAFPERSPHPLAPSMRDPYRAYLHQRWMAGCENGSQLWREIHAAGYRGTRAQVEKWAYHRRVHAAPSTPHIYRAALPTRRRVRRTNLASLRRLVWLLLRAPHTLSPDELATLRRIQQDREVAVSYDLAQQFLTIARQRRVERLDTWLAASAASHVAELQTFAAGLHQDDTCVRAALTEVWSTGPVEGHINRLKLVKRQMFGRANFDLLRQRVLHAV